MRKLFLYLVAAIALPVLVNGQDAHWSMIQWNPVYLNPAFSGFAKKANRINGIYRDQWRSVAVPYSTTHFSYDRRVVFNEEKGIRFGLGGQFMYDKAGDGALSTFRPGLNAAIGKYFNSNKQLVHIGISGAYTLKQVDFNKLTFENQYDGTQFDPNISPGEQFESNNAGYFDLGAGLNFNSKLKESGDIDVGVSAYNLTQPSYSFLNTSEAEPGTRIMAYTKANIKMGKSAWEFQPAFFYQNQKKAQEYLFQSLFSVRVSSPTDEDKDVRLTFGPGYRLDDAVIGYVGMNWNDLRVAFAFDGNISDFRQATNGRGAYEVSLNYEWEKSSKQTPTISVLKSGDEVEDPDEQGNFIAHYTVKVDNSSGNKGSYSLVDQPDFDKNVTILNTYVSGQITENFIGGGPYKLADEVEINKGDIHTYTLKVSSKYSADVMNCKVKVSECKLEEGGGYLLGYGLYNEVTLTTEKYTTTQQACLKPFEKTCIEKVPDLDITKHVSAQPSKLDTAGAFTVGYTVTISNNGDTSGFYNLEDVPLFDESIAINKTEISGHLSSTLTGTGPYNLAQNVEIAANEKHVYNLKVFAQYKEVLCNQSHVSECKMDQEGNHIPNNGLYNEARLTSEDLSKIAISCTQPPAYTDSLKLYLFFDNDYPNPRSTSVTTNISYDKLYENYLERRDTFVSVVGDEASTFFNDHVINGFESLDNTLSNIYTLLNKCDTIKLEIRGYTSPLASVSYNDALSSRRIESIVIYMKKWNNGKLKSLMDKGRLVVITKPLGKRTAPEGISDSHQDLKNSVYSSEASFERRVEIIRITLE